MKLSQVAVQLYTLRNHLKTPADIAASLKKVRAIGYTAVQASGLGPIAEDELLRILKGEGLTLCATHEDSDRILNEPAAIVDRLSKLGCRYTAYPFPRNIDFGSAEAVDTLIRKLEAAGKTLHDAGQVLTYHNHNHEFRQLDGEIILDRIYAKTNPVYLQGEIDTYWVAVGGCDPAAWCRKLKNRLPLLHMKDFQTTHENKPNFCEVGRGVLDWPGIIAAAEASGCEWFIVEQDVCPGDEFESLKISFDYIKSHLVS
jgi:sugar phosphate isomerase/epimerase